MPSQDQSNSKVEEYRSFYYKYLECCNAHDFEGMKSFYTSPLNVMDKPLSPDDVVAQFKPLVVAFPDWKWELRRLVIEGDYLSLHFRITGTHKGEFRGHQPTGRKVETTEFTLYHVVDGKFAEVWDLVDFEALVEQIK
ncbi:aspartyl-trna synthetase [Fusarium longipes]|uniref:Aspartyl-trna synthetase n=1 Tax=Fusarium longipes TaxID=694270 RepID=A0A395SSW7_9HYPO|nr:aspartyl-trna synthetase [Fusarium longipes]